MTLAQLSILVETEARLQNSEPKTTPARLADFAALASMNG